MGNNLEQELANFAVETNWEDLDSALTRDVKHLLLDALGCALAAVTTDKGKMTIALARRLGGPAESSIVGMGEKVSCNTAALANGELTGTLDYDVIMPGSHATTFIIPPPLALAESARASGKDLILATAIGYEISARIAGATKSGPLYGFEGPELEKFSFSEREGQAHFNFGAAAGAAKILKLDRNKMLNALGIAGHLCQVQTMVKQTNSPHGFLNKYASPGWQNTGAIMAVLLAEMGYTGDTTVLDPEHGFWKFCGYNEWHPDKVAKGLGEQWTFNKLKFKKYPCCGMLHTALDCLYSIIDQNNLMPEDIDSIKAFCHPTVEYPAFTNREIINIVDAQFSAAYVFAVAAHRLRTGIEWQDPDTMTNPKIVEFMGRITCQAHPGFGKQRQKDPTSDLSKVEVVAKGKKYVEERTHFRGTSSTDASITETELVEKFRHNASRILTHDKIESAIDTLLNLEKLPDISELMKQVTL
jgi:2-methylcitrate dehydratase PrpD